MVKEARREGAPEEGTTSKQKDGSEGNQSMVAVTFRTERRKKFIRRLNCLSKQRSNILASKQWTTLLLSEQADRGAS